MNTLRKSQVSPAGFVGLVLAVILLGLGVVATGTSVIYVKYLTRVEFVDLQVLRSARDALNVEWGRLQLEEAALTTHMRVEGAARRQLDMHMPAVAEIRLLQTGRE